MAVRTSEPSDDANPNHHLWRNGRLWWVAFTVHRSGWRQERIRASLGTDDVVEARRRRDALLADWAQRDDCTLSIRIAEPTRRACAI